MHICRTHFKIIFLICTVQLPRINEEILSKIEEEALVFEIWGTQKETEKRAPKKSSALNLEMGKSILSTQISHN